jgi:hypothetical protein
MHYYHPTSPENKDQTINVLIDCLSSVTKKSYRVYIDKVDTYDPAKEEDQITYLLFLMEVECAFKKGQFEPKSEGSMTLAQMAEWINLNWLD